MIRIGREIQCLPYARFLLNSWTDKYYLYSVFVLSQLVFGLKKVFVTLRVQVSQSLGQSVPVRCSVPQLHCLSGTPLDEP